LTQALHTGPEDTEPSNEGIKTGLGIFHPGKTIPPSALEHGRPSTLNGAPDNDLYETWHTENKKPTKYKKPGEEAAPPQECPVCPNVADTSLPAGVKETKKEDRPLILYAYCESEFARQNLKFFVDHGLHAMADFVFILNGPTDVDTTIIFKESDNKGIGNHDRSNIMVKRRDNTCFDLGAHAEVLNGVMGGKGWSDALGPIHSPEGQEPNDQKLLKDRYKRYILMNASIRGPFVPTWSSSCWSDAYLNKLTSKIKLVGMSYNCHTNRGHVQSMIWATDSEGLGIILTPAGIDECFENMPNAQNGEIRTTQLLRDKGYDVDVFLSVYHSKDMETKQRLLNPELATEGTEAKEEAKEEEVTEESKEQTTEEVKEGAKEVVNTDSGTGTDAQNSEEDYQEKEKRDTDPGTQQTSLQVPGDFWKSCTDDDWLLPGSYFGTFVHPYENLFMKSHRHIEDTILDRLTEWHDGSGYSSYDVCF
jgi:hypothetical protein